MSILIKGMEMPRTCRDFPLEQPYNGYNCAITRKSYSWALSDRPSDCPLISVSPHGRLIDADALVDKHKTMAYEDGGRSYSFHATAKAWVEAAPTIIPADPAEEGET